MEELERTFRTKRLDAAFWSPGADRNTASSRGRRSRRPHDGGGADLVRQHDELPGRAGRGDRPADRARKLEDYRGHLPTGAAPGDHDRSRDHGPDPFGRNEGQKLPQLLQDSEPVWRHAGYASRFGASFEVAFREVAGWSPHEGSPSGWVHGSCRRG